MRSASALVTNGAKTARRAASVALTVDRTASTREKRSSLLVWLRFSGFVACARESNRGDKRGGFGRSQTPNMLGIRSQWAWRA
jgi:hypothetical protein